MATVDLEKLRMSGAGKAIGVLTSGGDAQGRQDAGVCRLAAGEGRPLFPGTLCALPPVSARSWGSAIIGSPCPRSASSPLPVPGPSPTRLLPAYVLHATASGLRPRVPAGVCLRTGGGLGTLRAWPALHWPLGILLQARELPAPLPGWHVSEALFPASRAELGRSLQTLRARLFLVLKGTWEGCASPSHGLQGGSDATTPPILPPPSWLAGVGWQT